MSTQSQTSKSSAASTTEKPKLKICIRNLPPQLTEEQFYISIQPFLNDIDFQYYVPGKIKDKNRIDSRAYVHFVSNEALKNFIVAFGGHVFVTEKGTEQKINLEFAPYQNIPKSKQKKDARDSTIADDPEFQQFLQKLNDPVHTLPSAEKQLEERLLKEQIEPIVTTPLIEFLRDKHSAKPSKTAQREIEREKKRMEKEQYVVVKKRGKDEKEKREREERRKKREVEKEKPTVVWIAKKPLEPVQTKEKELEKPPEKPTVQETTQPQSFASSSYSSSSSRSNSYSRKKKNEVKIYAPKTKVIAVPKNQVNTDNQ